jgi:hypothetical protein
MLSSIYESERVARQLVSAISPAFPASREGFVGACEAFSISQLVDDSPASLAQAIFAIYDYSSEVLSQYPSIQYNIDDEILEPLWNLGEEIAQYDNISVAQHAVEEWVYNNTEC